MKTTLSLLTALLVCTMASFGQNGQRAQRLPVAARFAADVIALRDMNSGNEPARTMPGRRTVAASNHVLQILSEEWNGTAWQNSTRTTYTYDGNGYATSILQESWNLAATSWEPDTRTQYTNNGDGTVNQSVMQTMNDTSLQWENTTRTTSTYNGAKKLTEHVTESWVAGAWQNRYRSTNTYDVNDRLTADKFERWDVDASMWIAIQRTNYTYNANGTMSRYVQQTWDDASDSWTDFTRNSITYNTADKPTQELLEVFLGATWNPAQRTSRTFDGSGYLTHDFIEIWDFVASAWTPFSQTDYTNNSQGDPVLAVRQDWNATAAGWENKTRRTTTYGSSSGVAGARPAESLEVYPNPATGRFTIALSDAQAVHGAVQVQVFNALGTIVAQAATGDRVFPMDLSGQPAGVYMVRIAEGGITMAEAKVIVAESR